MDIEQPDKNPQEEIEDALSLEIVIKRLNKELRKLAKEMSEREARLICDSFETLQRERIRNSNRVKQMVKSKEPCEVLTHITMLMERLEKEMGAVLGIYGPTHPLINWMMEQKGVGALLAVRLYAFVDWNQKTPSQVWSFGGYNPNVIWGKGEKRPWNARLKRLGYLLGESFVKHQGKDNAFYSEYFTRKKRELWNQNINGKFADHARVRKLKVSKKTAAYKWYSGCVSAEAARMVANKTWDEDGPPPWDGMKPGDGIEMLPPAQIHGRARRWVVKLFLGHVWWKNRKLEGVTEGYTPYAPEMLAEEGHTEIIVPPE